jgi:hypothetical protein
MEVSSDSTSKPGISLLRRSCVALETILKCFRQQGSRRAEETMRRKQLCAGFLHTWVVVLELSQQW